MNNNIDISGRLHVSEKDLLVVGVKLFARPEGTYELTGEIDGERLVKVSHQNTYISDSTRDEAFRKEELYVLKLPELWQEKKEVVIRLHRREEEIYSYSLAVSTLIKQISDIRYNIDRVEGSGSRVLISGWFISDTKTDIALMDESGRSLEFQLQYLSRMDVVRVYPEVEPDSVRGFMLSVDRGNNKKLSIAFSMADRRVTEALSLNKDLRAKSREFVRILKEAKRNYKQYGIREALRRSSNREKGIVDNPFEKWRVERLPQKEELEAQRQAHFTYEPLFSIVVPLYKTPLNYLTELVDSVRAQTYTNWELCFSDGSGETSPLKGVLQKMQEEDPRVRFVANSDKLQISENTNRALEIARGDYIVFSDHDDLLAPDALYECVRMINDRPEIQMLYTDEDKVSMDGKTYFEPAFKPEFNKGLLNSANYICHLCVVSRELLEKVGGLNGEFDGAQDFDFVLRCAEETDRIYHIPKVLYHWRSHLDSTAGNPVSKVYAFRAGTRAVAAHYDRTGQKDFCLAEETVYLGITRTRYLIKEKPQVSVVIYCNNDAGLRENCISSIVAQSYENIQIILCGRDEASLRDYPYEKVIRKDASIAGLYNLAMSRVRGSCALFTNDSMEFTDKDCIRTLLGSCQRKDIAASGGRWRFNNEYLSHAGMVVGIGGCAARLYENCPYGDVGYLGRIVTQQNYSALSLDALMVDMEIMKELGGFDEEFSSDLTGVDWCLRAGEKGYGIFYDPYAQAVDHGTHSEYPHADRSLFNDKWKELLSKGDPYYNPNLSLDFVDFRLK